MFDFIGSLFGSSKQSKAKRKCTTLPFDQISLFAAEVFTLDKSMPKDFDALKQAANEKCAKQAILTYGMAGLKLSCDVLQNTIADMDDEGVPTGQAVKRLYILVLLSQKLIDDPMAKLDCLDLLNVYEKINEKDFRAYLHAQITFCQKELQPMFQKESQDYAGVFYQELSAPVKNNLTT